LVIRTAREFIFLPSHLEDKALPTYSEDDFERIAAAVGKDVSEIMRHEREFENAAAWYRSARRPRKVKKTSKAKAASPSEKDEMSSGNHKTPSEMRKKMNQIGAAARKLLKHLEVLDYREALDGPGDIDILAFLGSVEGGTEEEVVQATAPIGRLVEIVEAVKAARFFETRAHKAAEDAVHLGKLLPKGHQGDDAANEWIAAMMSLYEKITGRKARTSVIAPGNPDRGKAAGQLLRFLEAAGAPLAIEYSPDSWRARVRDNQTGGRRK
jgi:hypothetical protein